MGRKKVYIKGNHPIRKSIEKQYIHLNAEICDCWDDIFESDSKDTELVILTSPNVPDRMEEDFQTICLLKELVEKIPDGECERPVVHVLFQCSVTLELVLRHGLSFAISEKLDVYPFTIEDMWAKKVLVGLPGVTELVYPPLDRQPITSDSQSRVHLVICGFDSQAEAFAIHAALVAHFPNYRGDDRVPIRSRITIVDKKMESKRDAFIAKYQSLFDHSFYRTINVEQKSCEFHKPMYDGIRKDFVDVEWEFVDGSIADGVVREKISTWSKDERQQLTILISYNDEEENLNSCLSLPRVVHECEIPVFVRVRRSDFVETLISSAGYKHVYPFGMNDCGYDVTMPLVKMARLLKYFYDCSYGDKGIPTEFDLDEVKKAWNEERSIKMRFSNVYNVMTIPAKMHSVGHNREDADTFYALNHQEIKLLAETEHNRWCVERLILGDRPCTDEERKKISRNIQDILEARQKGMEQPIDLKRKYKKDLCIHYDLCAYDELGVDATGKNAQTYDYDLTASIPLIYKTYYEEVNNEYQTD